MGPDARLAEPCADAGDQLGERERLREIVGGAELQASDLRLDVGERREDQDTLVGAGLHQTLQDGHPVQVRQEEVEHDQLVASRSSPSRGPGRPSCAPSTWNPSADSARETKLTIRGSSSITSTRATHRDARWDRADCEALMTEPSCRRSGRMTTT